MTTVSVLPLSTVPDLVSPPRPLALRRVEFGTWLKTARPGSRIEYHRGHLCVDRAPKLSASDNRTTAELNRLALAAMEASEQGLVHLVQRRHGPEDFSYLAIKARLPVKRHRAPYPPLKLSETH